MAHVFALVGGLSHCDLRHESFRILACRSSCYFTLPKTMYRVRQTSPRHVFGPLSGSLGEGKSPPNVSQRPIFVYPYHLSGDLGSGNFPKICASSVCTHICLFIPCGLRLRLIKLICASNDRAHICLPHPMCPQT